MHEKIAPEKIPPEKIAVVLFNLGGPDKLASVKPFLTNLFSDKAIIGLPAFFRIPLAKFIAARREKEACHIYEKIGGSSPLLANTEAQAQALQQQLQALYPQATLQCFTVMRYWHPRAAEMVEKIKSFAPTRMVLLPLYPHYSTTTTASSFADFKQAAQMAGLGGIPLHALCCYPTLPGLVAAHVALIKPVYEKMRAEAARQGLASPRILFSGHGLPEKVIKAGDPYQSHIEATTRAVVAALAIPGLDYQNTYQSRVGPLKWITPYTDAMIIEAGKTKTPLLVVPIAFVSEHSETLYEIGQQYRELATQHGVPHYAVIPALATHPAFIAGLADLVGQALANGEKSCKPDGGVRICAAEFGKCGCVADPSILF